MEEVGEHERWDGGEKNMDGVKEQHQSLMLLSSAVCHTVVE